MKNLVSFYLKRRFLSRFTIILGIVVFGVCGFLAHADVLVKTDNRIIVYLDESCTNIKEQLMNRNRIYKENKEGSENYCTLYFEEGWILSGTDITEELRKQVEDDIRSVESEIYLRKADLIEKEFIERYRKSFTVRTEDSKKADISTLVISGVFYLILTYSNLISNEIIYEKSTHMLDMIICSVGERIHFFSKILTAYLSLIIQAGWIILCRFFWLVIRFTHDHFRGLLEFAQGYVDVDTISLNVESLILLSLLIILSLLFIQIIMMAGTCLFRDSEEAATFQNIYYVILIALYYLFVIKGGPVNRDTVVSTVLSFTPIVSMVFMPIRVLSGKAGALDIIMSTVITTGVLALMIEIMLPVYKKLLLHK